MLHPYLTHFRLLADHMGSISVEVTPIKEIQEWLDNNVALDVHYEVENLLFTTDAEYLIIVFEDDADAALFELMWG